MKSLVQKFILALFVLSLWMVGCVGPDEGKPALTPEEAALSQSLLPLASPSAASATDRSGLKYKGDWNNFPDYLQNLVEGMQARWETRAKASRYRPKFKSTVAVTFVLSSDGRIEKITSVTGSSDRLAGSWCVLAIQPTESFSYGTWSDEMVRKLGHSQELTFNFIYK